MHQYLTSQSALTSIVPALRWYQAGNVVDVPQKPFVVVRWLAPVPLAVSFGRQLRLDVHDNRGSYAHIDAFNKAVQPILNSVIDLQGSDGRVTECSYLGNGGDQEDETYGTNYSFTSWQVIGVDL
jgi:hypothetical protein